MGSHTPMLQFVKEEISVKQQPLRLSGYIKTGLVHVDVVNGFCIVGAGNMVSNFNLRTVFVPTDFEILSAGRDFTGPGSSEKASPPQPLMLLPFRLLSPELSLFASNSATKVLKLNVVSLLLLFLIFL